MAKKSTPKLAPKPAPKPPVLRRPVINPIDTVRNPNFGAAMAQQDYFNNLSRLVAERNARGPEYTLMPIGGTGITEEQKQRLSPDERRNLEAAIAMRERGLGGPISQNPTPPNLMPIGNNGVTSGTAYNQIPPMSTGGTELPPEFFNLAPAYDVSKLLSNYQAQRDGPTLMPIGQFSPEQIQSLSPDRRQALEQRMGAQQSPSLSQMQDYNRMLQQGIQNSNTMNQGAMANFANMQPGMQAPQQPRPTIPNPAMPAAGMGMQQPRQVPVQRNLSTPNNTPARFG
jgi:hypothetical protein